MMNDGEDLQEGKHRGRARGQPARLAYLAAAAFRELVALLIPVDCVCCGKEDSVLCAACARKIRVLCAGPFRAETQAPALLSPGGEALLPVVAAAPYRDELAQALLSFKRHGQSRLAGALGTALAKALQAAAGGYGRYTLVPVPSSGAAYRKRGFSPVHLLLAGMRRRGTLAGCEVLDALVRKPASLLPTQASALRDAPRQLRGFLTGWPVPGQATGQKGLGRAGRARRVRGSMGVRHGSRRRRLRGRRCLVVDDVLTTGATLAEAARAIEAAGGIVCGAVVLAATRPPAHTGPVSHMNQARGEDSM